MQHWERQERSNMTMQVLHATRTQIGTVIKRTHRTLKFWAVI